MSATEKNILNNLTAGSSAHAQEAANRLARQDFPGRKSEAWKYTRVGKLVNSTVKRATSTIPAERFFIDQLDSYKIIISNGNLETSNLPSLNGVVVKQIEESDQYLNSLTDKEEIFTNINTAFDHDGVLIHVPKNVVLDKPIEIVNVIDGQATIAQPRKLIVIEQSAQAHVIDGYYSAESGFAFTNGVVEIIVKENARLHLDKIQYESGDHWNISSEYVYQESNSNFTINTVTLNGGTVRNGLNIIVDGENCETNLNGLYLLKENQHVDNHTLVDHKKPNCTSSELYKGMIDDSATGVFNGKVFVRQDAQKIEAFQQNNNIVMTDQATMNAKPELEIYADDVKCSHGSTTGQFDEEAVFYLRSRGIGEDKARKLLVAAFAGDVLNKITNEMVRTHIDKLLNERFGWDF